jgi:hypothetical protein
VSANPGGFPNMMKIAFEIRKVALSLAVLAAILLPALYAVPAHAVYHAWVSHSGNDGSDCTVADPCASFARALSQTAGGGLVGCLDSENFGVPVITISVVIDCRGTVSTNLTDDSTVSCGTAIVINAPGNVVTLRGLNLFGVNGCGATGILIQAAAAVYIEDCAIENFSQKGILDQRTTGLTKLVIKNTIVRNNTSAGIVAGATPKNSVVLENVQSVGNTYGIAVATGNNVIINRSVMSQNTIAGIEADPGAQVFADSTEISHNVNYGIYALGKVTLANSDVAFNTSSIFGSTTSFGNNRFVGNGGGTAPTPAGATSTDFGQQ